MPYTHVRYIAYQVPTVAVSFGGKAVYGMPTGTVSDPPRLFGDTDALGPDATVRMQRFVGAMIEARKQLKLLGGDNTNTLKVFMAPEFYFRRADQGGFGVGGGYSTNQQYYDYKQYKAIKNVLKETLFWTPDPDDNTRGLFDGWLALAGTVMWTADDKTEKLAKRTPAGKTAYFNTAVYAHTAPELGGSAGNGKGNLDSPHQEMPVSHGTQKNQASSIDGVPLDASAEKLFPNQFPGKRRKHGFRIGGIQCGLDICLDHFFQANPLNDIRVTRKLAINHLLKDVKLHLLTAGGMTIIGESVAANTGGYIFRNDGYVPEANRKAGTFTNCRSITGYEAVVTTFQTQTYVVGYYANGQPMHHSQPVQVQNRVPANPTDSYAYANMSGDALPQSTIDINKGDSLYLPSPGGCKPSYWTGHPQKVLIFPTYQIR